MFCAHCGNELREGQKFCNKCGMRTESSAMRTATTKDEPSDSKNETASSKRNESQSRRCRNGVSKPILVVMSIACVVGIVLSILMLSSNSLRNEGNNAGDDEYHPGETVIVEEGLYYSEPEAAHMIVDEESGVEYVDNELILYAAPGTDEEVVAEIVEPYGGEVVGAAPQVGSFQVRFDETYTHAELVDLSDELEARSDIEAVSRNVVFRLEAQRTTGDPVWKEDADETWGLVAIKAPEAWDIVEANNDVHVGIIDTQIYSKHEDLDGAVVETMPSYETSFSAKNNDVDDEGRRGEGRHGTHVAGIIGARDNGKGTVGVAHGCSMYGWTFVSSKDREGDEVITSTYGLDVALVYLVATNNCRVVNMSVGMPKLQIANSINSPSVVPQERNQLIEESKSCENAIRALVRANYDFVICKSAGNCREEGGLADYDFLGFIDAEDVKSRIIIVGSVGQDSRRATGVFPSDFSCGGERVDVVAPGENIYSDWFEFSKPLFGSERVTSTYEYSDGTSMATPMVSGVAALMVAANPEITSEEIKYIICNAGDGGGYLTASFHGVQMIDAEMAVKCASGIAEVELPINRAEESEFIPELALDNSSANVFADLPQSLVFAWAGCWATELNVNSDGSFTGYFSDWDAQPGLDENLNGIKYETYFEGSFTEPERISDTEYHMQLQSLHVTSGMGDRIEDGVHIVEYPAPIHGLGDEVDAPSGNFKLYLPGHPTADIPEAERMEMHIASIADTPTLDFYAIVNVDYPAAFCGGWASSGVESDTASTSSGSYGISKEFAEQTAIDFMEAWWGDWTFEDGRMVMASQSTKDRCLPYIAEGTDLYDKFSDDSDLNPASGSPLVKGASFSVLDISADAHEYNSCLVDITVVGTQNTLTEEMYEDIKTRPLAYSYKVEFNDEGYITSLFNRDTGQYV